MTDTDVFCFYLIVLAWLFMAWFTWMWMDSYRRLMAFEDRRMKRVKRERGTIVALGVKVGDPRTCQKCGMMFRARKGTCITYCFECRGSCWSYEVGRCDIDEGPCEDPKKANPKFIGESEDKEDWY